MFSNGRPDDTALTADAHRTPCSLQRAVLLDVTDPLPIPIHSIDQLKTNRVALTEALVSTLSTPFQTNAEACCALDPASIHLNVALTTPEMAPGHVCT